MSTTQSSPNSKRIVVSFPSEWKTFILFSRSTCSRSTHASRARARALKTKVNPIIYFQWISSSFIWAQQQCGSNGTRTHQSRPKTFAILFRCLSSEWTNINERWMCTGPGVWDTQIQKEREGEKDIRSTAAKKSKTKIHFGCRLPVATWDNIITWFRQKLVHFVRSWPHGFAAAAEDFFCSFRPNSDCCSDFCTRKLLLLLETDTKFRFHSEYINANFVWCALLFVGDGMLSHLIEFLSLVGGCEVAPNKLIEIRIWNSCRIACRENGSATNRWINRQTSKWHCSLLMAHGWMHSHRMSRFDFECKIVNM